MRRGSVALFIVLALVVPTAIAGSARRPEIADPEDNLDPATDILSAWFSAESAGLRFHIRLIGGSSPEFDGDRIYWFTFTVPETETNGAAVLGYSNDGLLRSYLGTARAIGGLDDRSSAFQRGVSFNTLANEGLVLTSADLGRPSTWSAVIPWGSIDGLEPGATVTNLVVGASRYDRAARAWSEPLDTAATGAPFVAEPESRIAILTGGALPITVPGWVIPTILVATTAIGIAAGFALGRPALAQEPPELPPARLPPRPPGQRFQRAPGRK